MRQILILTTIALVVFFQSNILTAQTCPPTSPVCVPANGYAFQFANNTHYGLKFNTTTSDYEFTNSTGNAVAGFDANSGNLSFPSGGALQVAANKYAFQFSGNPNYGLFFNATNLSYDFRTSNGNAIFELNADNGNVDGDGKITMSKGQFYSLDNSTDSADGALIIGYTSSRHLSLDWNSIESRSAASITSPYATHALRLNELGGDVFVTNNGGRSYLSGVMTVHGANQTVGINVSNAEAELHVNGADNNGVTATVKIESGAQSLLLDGNEIDANSTLYINNNNASDIILTNGGGQVGIGTAPTSKLHVVHPSSTFGIYRGFKMQNQTDSDNWQQYVFGTNDLGLLYNSSLKGVFDDVSGSYIVGSDRKLKKDISSLDQQEMMNKLLRLNPTAYHFKDQNKDGRKYFGFIAQELENVIPELAVYNEEADQYGVSYTELIPIIIAGMQSQHKEIELLKAQLSQCCKSAVEDSPSQENKESTYPLQADNPITKLSSEPVLGQNVPNPFRGITTIRYFIPSDVESAEIKIFDFNGKEITSYLLTIGNGIVEFNQRNLAAGIYTYSLIIDGELHATKKLLME